MVFSVVTANNVLYPYTMYITVALIFITTYFTCQENVSVHYRRHTSFLHIARLESLKISPEPTQDQGALTPTIPLWNRPLHTFHHFTRLSIRIRIRNPLNSQILTTPLLFPQYQSIRIINTLNETLGSTSFLRKH
jgi:hypothetical protein